MVGVVGAGVVLEGVDALLAADRADRAPGEVVEVDEQVGRDAVHLLVDLLRLVDARGERLAVRARDRRQPLGELVADALEVLRLDRALGLAAADVEEDAAVVAALAPGGRAAPVDADVAQRRDAVRLARGLQQALARAATR